MATKNDHLKPDYSLLPRVYLEAAVRALQYGAQKYGRYNYCTGKPLQWSRMYAALQRHLWAWWDGEDKDLESGLSHLDHAAACLAILLWAQEHTPLCDDRGVREGEQDDGDYYS